MNPSVLYLKGRRKKEKRWGEALVKALLSGGPLCAVAGAHRRTPAISM